MTYIHNINPIAISFGGINIYWYGIIYFLGFLATYLYLREVAKRELVDGFGADEALGLLLWLGIGGLIFARIFDVLVYYPENWRYIYAFWQGGMSFHGGLIGGFGSAYAYCKIKKLDFDVLSDLIVFPYTLILGIGRIGNFINGELYGIPTSVWYGVKFKGVEGFRHPSQLYEAGKNFFMFIVLYFQKGMMFPDGSKIWNKGSLFWTFITMYGVLRFFITFYRESTTLLFGLGIGQWLSLVMIPIGLYMLWRKNK